MKNNLLKIFIGLLVYFVILGTALYVIPKIMVYALDSEYPMASIASGSMWPVLKRGDLVFIEGVRGKDEVGVGDIIVFKTERGFTIHRVIEKKADSVITKGDANRVADLPVKYEQIVGKALSYKGKPVRFPLLGELSLILKGN